MRGENEELEESLRGDRAVHRRRNEIMEKNGVPKMVLDVIREARRGSVLTLVHQGLGLERLLGECLGDRFVAQLLQVRQRRP